MRFTTICHAARQLATGSPCLFRKIETTTHSRQQSLALLRWLSSASRGPALVVFKARTQQMTIDRQLGRGLGMQGDTLKHLCIV